ncbi:iron-containing redox enzyme family protein [Streptomyces sp. NBRC 109706]|uniref:iron-containing redox enzyme family protein n=1 Tax=Streptomyces sp. NBRC 109706 TaxID=1550035 RepID=UPI000A8D6803|nr:iron-containing redox enzyme family protein [Streptomyces sp. NBRC 109706]
MTVAPPVTPSATPSAALGAKLALATPALHRAIERLWRPDGLRERYLRYLAAMHPLLVASVPLLERAAARCADLDDPWAPRLAAYYRRHAEEERDHDVWLLADLAAAGGHRDEAPHRAVVELAGAQYYRVEHEHPVALLGYMAVLEGNAPAPWLPDRLAEATGLPPAAFRTLREHAALDDGHLDELLREFDGLPLTARQRTVVSVSALHTAGLLTQLFRSLASDPPPSGPPPGDLPTDQATDQATEAPHHPGGHP